MMLLLDIEKSLTVMFIKRYQLLLSWMLVNLINLKNDIAIYMVNNLERLIQFIIDRRYGLKREQSHITNEKYYI